MSDYALFRLTNDGHIHEKTHAFRMTLIVPFVAYGWKGCPIKTTEIVVD